MRSAIWTSSQPRWLRAAVVCIGGIGLSACVSSGNLGMVARSGANPGDLLTQPHTFRDLGPAEGQACRYFLLSIIPWGDSSPSTALDRALAGSGGNGLLNATVSSSLFGFIPYWNLFSFTCTAVRGTAIRIDLEPPEQTQVPPLPPPAPPAPPPAPGPGE